MCLIKVHLLVKERNFYIIKMHGTMIKIHWIIFAAINVLKLKSSNDLFCIIVSFIADTCDKVLKIKLELSVEWLAVLLPT